MTEKKAIYTAKRLHKAWLKSDVWSFLQFANSYAEGKYYEAAKYAYYKVLEHGQNTFLNVDEEGSIFVENFSKIILMQNTKLWRVLA